MELEKFFEKIDRKMIDDFIKDNQEGHLNLDFKTIAKAIFSDRNDRKNFAKSLSGFVNSSGGIIIWGIEARPNRQGIDCASAIRNIQPLPQLLSKLNEFSGQFVDPIVEGIKHRRIPASGKKGLAMTLVPESNAGPHMAKAGEDRYYKRSGSSFYKMEHFDFEDMFGRRKKPKLSLYLDIKRGFSVGGQRPTRFECKIFVGIENKGRGLAKNVALAIEVDEPYHLKKLSDYTSGGYDFLQVPRPGSEKTIFFLGSDAVVHPSSSVIVTIITFEVSVGQHKVRDVVVDYEIMAEDMRIVEDRKIISGKEIRVENTKSGKPRFIPINNVVYETLRNEKRQNGNSPYVFPNPRIKKPYVDIKKSFAEAVKNAKISGLRFHDMRHPFASRLVAAGVDLITVKELLGHHSVRVTERYTHSNTEQKKNAVEGLASGKRMSPVPILSTKKEGVLANAMVTVN